MKAYRARTKTHDLELKRFEPVDRRIGLLCGCIIDASAAPRISALLADALLAVRVTCAPPSGAAGAASLAAEICF